MAPRQTQRRRDIPPIHPGEILKADFLDPLHMSVNALSHCVKVPRARLNVIVRGRRAITADTAIRLALYFGISEQFWMNLQTHYELERAKAANGDRLDREIKPRAA